MEQVLRQLERVRRVGRGLLFAQSAMQCAAALLLTGMTLAALDYLLPLPGWLRLAVDILLVVGAAWWLWERLGRVRRFWPDLGTLALRAERLYPQLAGVLASGVEFAASPADYADPERTGRMAEASVARAQSVLRQTPDPSLRGLINPRHTLRIGATFAVVLAMAGIVAAAAPNHTAIALQRWLLPLGDAQWPKRTTLRSLVVAEFWADDAPVPLEVLVERGHRESMRVWARYRLLDADGRPSPAQDVLLTRQGSDDEPLLEGGVRYTQLIDTADARTENPESTETRRWRSMEFWFEAGDDQTAPQRLTLLPRPAVQRATAHIEPPPYARGLVASQDVTLSHTGGTNVATVGALIGSGATLRFELNEVTLVGQDNPEAILPGLLGAAPQVTFEPRAIEAGFVVRDTVQTGVQLQDEHGLTNLSDATARIYRIEARADEAPSASMVEPKADESVLATALISVEGAARDDVGLEQMSLRVAPPHNDPAEVPSQDPGRRAQMTARHDLDLATLTLAPGDVVEIRAVALDVFDLDGLRHEQVLSSPRLLRIIDTAALVQQLRTELAAIRQQALRLESRQMQIAALEPATAAPLQQQVTQRVQTQQTQAATVTRRIDRNRLDEATAAPFRQLLDEAGQLLDAAQGASEEAAKKLEASPNEARPSQEQVAENLRRLAALLDQSGDMLALQLELQEMLRNQQVVAGDTRQMLPRTLGQSPDQLKPEDREVLRDLSERQSAMSPQMQNLVSRMQTTAQTLSRQSNDPKDQAAAAALSEASAIAQRQGLTQTMEQAGSSTSQNQLAAAGRQQQQAVQVMEEMLRELANQQKRQQEILRRRLQQLAEAIEKLIEQQKAQLALLKEAAMLPPLAEAMSQLYRNTLVVQQDAAALGQEMQPVAALLEDAGGHQQSSVAALREANQTIATVGEEGSLSKLEEALKLVKEMEQQLSDDQSRMQREQLRQEYLRLAKEQRLLRDQTLPLAEVAEPSRKERADILQLGVAEADLRNTVRDLGEKVEQTVVFTHLHGRVDEVATGVADRLRQGKAEARDPADQLRVAVMLEAMAEALRQAQLDEDFARQQNPGGGGGGGGGGGPLVPPLAELRLLREVQASIHEETRAAQKLEPALQRAMILELSAQQRELAGLSQRLIEMLQPQPPPAAPAQPEEQQP